MGWWVPSSHGRRPIKVLCGNTEVAAQRRVAQTPCPARGGPGDNPVIRGRGGVQQRKKKKAKKKKKKDLRPVQLFAGTWYRSSGGPVALCRVLPPLTMTGPAGGGWWCC